MSESEDSGKEKRLTEVVVLEAVLSVSHQVGVPVGNGREPSGERAGGLDVVGRRQAQRSEHGDVK
jgi:hypothetical protein